MDMENWRLGEAVKGQKVTVTLISTSFAFVLRSIDSYFQVEVELALNRLSSAKEALKKFENDVSRSQVIEALQRFHVSSLVNCCT